MATSPTTRTLGRLRREGWRAQVVERWNPHARVRQDFFGAIDIIAVREGQTLGVQCTSASNVADRVRKLMQLDAIEDLLRAGWIVQVWGWRKTPKGRWTCRIKRLVLAEEETTDDMSIAAIEETRTEQTTSPSIKLGVVRDGIHHLEDLAYKARAAAEAYRDAIKATAEEAGIHPTALRAFVNATLREDGGSSARERTEQLALLFGEVE